MRRGIHATFHYLSLHHSDFAAKERLGCSVLGSCADRYTDCLLRLPLYNSMTTEDVTNVTDAVVSYLKESFWQLQICLRQQYRRWCGAAVWF